MAKALGIQPVERPNTKCCMPDDLYRFAVPRASFFTLRLAEPRAYSRGFSGFSVLRFLRDARLVFLRSSLVSALVFAMSAVRFSLSKSLLASSYKPHNLGSG